MQAANLTADTLAIWQAGVDAVTPRRLFADKVRLHGTLLEIDDTEVELAEFRRLIVVGAGKASAAMATALHKQILTQLPDSLNSLEVLGWINCPEGAVVERLPNIYLHEARPAGINSPTQRGVDGTQQILKLVGECDDRDLVICLISGGGSALLVAPADGITLQDKQAVAELVARGGGNIQQLNTIRRALSQVKGGGLARACKAGRMITVILSDVLGDPLDTIASGPTVSEQTPDPYAALDALSDLQLSGVSPLANVVAYLKSQAVAPRLHLVPSRKSEHIILGNNSDAVDAAGVKAVELGYRYVMQAARRPEPDVLEVARTAARATLQVAWQNEVDCWISGGEPTVTLPSHGGGRGGRNQQLALAVLQLLRAAGWPRAPMRELVFLSGGTDGEDGPTDAAGAWVDRAVDLRARDLELKPSVFLNRADAYHFFQQAGGLLRTGPTGTNVCDLRIALARPSS